MNWTALLVFVALFLVVTVIGFVAVRWRRADLDLLHEWGLAGRRLGTIVAWFLLGGDIYTAYTFIAVPALMFGAGAIGFFPVPDTIVAYIFVFAVFPRLWQVAKKHGYVTAADFVRGRFDSGALAFAVAVTGILATMPYIALQLIGIQVVIGALGFTGTGFWADLPLIIAFAILAAFTYTSGLRAPALIAIVKDIMIYITVIAAIVVVPGELGGYAKIFAAVPAQKLLLAEPSGTNLGQISAYFTLALGSAMALFLYPHCVTGVLSAASSKAVKRNMALLPAYSFLLALIGLMGFMAIAAGVADDPAYAPFFKQYGLNFAVPALILKLFPSWFAGFAFATIGIGALVPAAIMSIGAANLFTRSVYREYFRRDCPAREESQVAKIVSLVVKFGALAFVILLPNKYAIQLQLLGGVWIIQTFPAVISGLFTGWFHRWALLSGWLTGMALGTFMVAEQGFATSVYPLTLAGYTIPTYAALASVIVNIAAAVVLTLLFDALGFERGGDATTAADYLEEASAA